MNKRIKIRIGIKFSKGEFSAGGFLAGGGWGGFEKSRLNSQLRHSNTSSRRWIIVRRPHLGHSMPSFIAWPHRQIVLGWLSTLPFPFRGVKYPVGVTPHQLGSEFPNCRGVETAQTPRDRHFQPPWSRQSRQRCRWGFGALASRSVQGVRIVEAYLSMSWVRLWIAQSSAVSRRIRWGRTSHECHQKRTNLFLRK
jgi:hypothetical protein